MLNSNNSVLTQEQLDRMEENRLLALKKLQFKKQQKEHIATNGSQAEHCNASTEQVSPSSGSGTGMGINVPIPMVSSNGTSFDPISNIAPFNGDISSHATLAVGSTDVPFTIDVDNRTSQQKRFMGNVHFELFSTTTFSVSDISIFSSIFKSIPGFKYSTAMLWAHAIYL